jgi:hypothetical protein
MLEETPLTLVGQQTPRAVIYKSESHKLHQAFSVKSGDTVVKGQPVKLNEDGTISPYTGTGIYLGLAVTDSVYPAYQAQRNFPVEVTVMVEGFAIVNWVSAAASLTAGYVTPGDLLNNRYVKAAASTAETNFIALNPADEANEVVQVLVK